MSRILSIEFSDTGENVYVPESGDVIFKKRHYTYSVKVFGIRVFSRDGVLDKKISNLYSDSKTIGFAKK